MSEARSGLVAEPIWNLAQKGLESCSETVKFSFANGALWGKSTTLLALSSACKEVGVDLKTQVEISEKIEECLTKEWDNANN